MDGVTLGQKSNIDPPGVDLDAELLHPRKSGAQPEPEHGCACPASLTPRCFESRVARHHRGLPTSHGKSKAAWIHRLAPDGSASNFLVGEPGLHGVGEPVSRTYDWPRTSGAHLKSTAAFKRQPQCPIIISHLSG